ncbi:hypothetical protein BN873_p20007 [Candidatus Competibacter denitrificans Run_A_D11]|uniref:Uncharacterized protein n=1 Tax=Candidatus Competibacter denitrificans Run_A_D11 TaxID=1400863 RepID=W6MA80_9GAMM|nr:hypothetical protein BN873_p20007 [Candidatus Competibacter denitrificans Run_A_D11]
MYAATAYRIEIHTTMYLSLVLLQ